MTTFIDSDAALPETYDGLVGAFMPRPIHDDVGHQNAQAAIDALAGLELNEEQEDYLELLSTLVVAYEDDVLKNELSTLPRGPEMLSYLCKENKITGVELGRILGVGRSQASLLLNGDRKLTVAHLQKLSEHFNVSSELFMA